MRAAHRVPGRSGAHVVDTNHLHVVTWWAALRRAGHPVTVHAVYRAVGLASDDLVAQLLGERTAREEDGDLDAAHKALYAPYFERLHALPDAGRLLRRLAADGWTVVLATSAGDDELSALRRAIDADDAIKGTASADDVTRGKPAPEPVQRALELAGTPPERAMFVGDTVWDMRAGSRAWVRCVGLLCGGIPRADLEEAGAAAVFDDPADLLASLPQGPRG
ncbi:HAD family hydrolase [Streptomyces sp. NPDC005811]|uniref:HAD family hydrolase n=1 Tax=Streptomyces sp. NPDC005811 TaxID=3154565 RepID=UPI0033C892E0